MPRSLEILKNKLSGSPEIRLSLKLQTYGNQNNPKRQEGAPKFYLLTHTIPDFYTRKKG